MRLFDLRVSSHDGSSLDYPAKMQMFGSCLGKKTVAQKFWWYKWFLAKISNHVEQSAEWI